MRFYALVKCVAYKKLLATQKRVRAVSDLSRFTKDQRHPSLIRLQLKLPRWNKAGPLLLGPLVTWVT